jgi:hypothetical protein
VASRQRHCGGGRGAGRGRYAERPHGFGVAAFQSIPPHLVQQRRLGHSHAFAGGDEEADTCYEDAARHPQAGATPAKEGGAHGDFATLSPSASMIARYDLSWFSRWSCAFAPRRKTIAAPTSFIRSFSSRLPSAACSASANFVDDRGRRAVRREHTNAPMVKSTPFSRKVVRRRKAPKPSRSWCLTRPRVAPISPVERSRSSSRTSCVSRSWW